jgi:hypothetical protein
MGDNGTSQEFLFQRIKEMMPLEISMVDEISTVLNISADSAYRRIRGETPLVLDEVSVLCNHFHISLDQLLEVKTNSLLFQNIRVNNQGNTYSQYLSGLIQLVQQIEGFLSKEIIYLTKDIPIFHNFYFLPLNEFRYYFWMKNILGHPDFLEKEFEFKQVPETVISLSRQLIQLYSKIPSVEIWNTECINSTISQIEFCKDSGLFSSVADIKTVYEALEETILHIQAQAESGIKFMPGEKPLKKKTDFRFFYNRVVLGDNTILVTTDHTKSVHLNYNVLNYLTTSDEEFCKKCNEDLQNLMRKATQISQTSEKQRNIFFGILLSKIQDRKRNL